MDNSIRSKTCTACRATLPATTEFFSRVGTGLNSQCKACRNAKAVAARAANPEKYAAYQKKYRTANDEKCRERMREYYWRDPSRSSERSKRTYNKNRKASVQRVMEWRKANPEKVSRYARATHYKRKLALGNSPSHFTSSDLLKQLEAQNFRCYWCQKKLEQTAAGFLYQVDHIFALSKGGTNSVGNICCACPSCNNSKGAKTPNEFNGRLL